jgi:hypothetical protein
MKTKFYLTGLTILLGFGCAKAQGPTLDYFFNKSTTLPWAKASIYFKSGSQQEIKFFPVNAPDICPFGVCNYTKDVNVEGKVTLLTELITEDQPNSFENQIVLYCFDRNAEEKRWLAKEISQIYKQGATAIILFSNKNEEPFIKIFEDNDLNQINIPIVATDKTNTESILQAAGYEIEEFWQNLKKGKLPSSKALICNFRLWIKGDFERIETPKLTVRYNNDLIKSESIREIVETNNRAQGFIYQLFEPIAPERKAQTVTYFSDYDEKLFYTSHWGKGFAYQGDVFSVFEQSIPTFELAVHEFTHTFFYKNWGGNMSFLSEGVAMYAEAMSIGSSKNNSKTIDYIKKGELLPLKDLVEIEIGEDSKYTQMGYYASGSFVEFLIDTYGQKKFLELWNLVRGWSKVYNKSLNELEKEWHRWLAKTSN